jgi:hypothetical protein
MTHISKQAKKEIKPYRTEKPERKLRSGLNNNSHRHIRRTATCLVLTGYHNIQTDFIRYSNGVEVKHYTLNYKLQAILHSCHKISCDMKTQQ